MDCRIGQDRIGSGGGVEWGAVQMIQDSECTRACVETGLEREREREVDGHVKKYEFTTYYHACVHACMRSYTSTLVRTRLTITPPFPPLLSLCLHRCIITSNSTAPQSHSPPAHSADSHPCPLQTRGKSAPTGVAPAR